MNLREIEISGFKSFADRTRILLPGHVVAVVGPNGAGKSNIADAVQWCLGEQSPKSLRGRKMLDVIFSGNHKRPAAGQAEVQIVFEDDTGNKYRVGRRLLRSGDSEYLLEGRPARLKDVHDFAHRFSISTQGNFLVEQGRVEALLAANPEERRLVFEEVAGIAHYKENRRSALHRLDSAQANFLRLNDIVVEVETQMASLKRQAAKADRFVRLSDELREKRRAFWGRLFAQLLGRKAGLDQDVDLLRQEREKKASLLARLESEWEAEKHKLNEHESSLSELIQSIHQNELERERREQENKRCTDRILTGQQRTRQIESDLEALAGRLDLQEREAARLADEMEAFTGKEETVQGEAREAEARLESLQARIENLDERQGERRRQSFGAAQEQTEKRAELKALQEDMKRLEEREGRMEREKASLQERRDGSEAACEELSRKLAEARADSEERTTEREETAAALGEMRDTLEKKAGDHAEAAREAARLEARLQVLREQESALHSSAHAYLAEKRPALVAETLAARLKDVPDGSLRPLAAVFGELLEGYVGTSWASLTDALSSLSRERGGTAVFFFEDLPDLPRNLPSGVSGFEGFAGWLHDVPGIPKDIRRHVPLTALVETPEQAKSFVEKFEVPAVTGEGLFVHPGGWSRGGAGGEGGGLLLEIRHEISRVDQALKESAARSASLEEEVGSLRTKVRETEQELERQGEQERVSSNALAQVEGEYEKAEGERERLGASLELLDMEWRQARDERGSFVRREEEIEAALVALEERRREVDAALEEGEAELSELRRQVNAAHEEVASTRARASEVTERAKAARDAVGSARSRLEESRETARRLERERETLAAQKESLTRQLTDGDQSLRDLLISLEDSAQKRSAFEEKARSMAEALAAQEKGVREVRETLEEMQSELSEKSQELAGVAADLKNLVERIEETFEEDPETMAEDFKSSERMSEEERSREQQALVKLDQKLASLGAVNMLAREEYDELAGRHKFLLEQRSDLEEAVSSLQETIRKINRTIRERFMEAFHAVQGHFAALFKEIFEGGEARLSLLDEQTPLESGVEIYVQPPGKKLESI
ncbi:MAG: chromosome segregation protein SMC, partial [Acidobacteriota bacterium]